MEIGESTQQNAFADLQIRESVNKVVVDREAPS